jgi:hypothetical protein
MRRASWWCRHDEYDKLDNKNSVAIYVSALDQLMIESV